MHHEVAATTEDNDNQAATTAFADPVSVHFFSSTPFQFSCSALAVPFAAMPPDDLRYSFLGVVLPPPKA